MSVPLAPVQAVPVAAPAPWWRIWGRCRSGLAVLSVPHSASSCLENTSGSHDLLALKKYFHLNYTNITQTSSPAAPLGPALPIPGCAPCEARPVPVAEQRGR